MLRILPHSGQGPLPGIEVNLTEVAAFCVVSLGVKVDVCSLPERESTPGLSFCSASTFTRASFLNFGSRLTCACVSAQSFDLDRLRLIPDFFFLSPLGLCFIMAKTILSGTAENSDMFRVSLIVRLKTRLLAVLHKLRAYNCSRPMHRYISVSSKPLLHTSLPRRRGRSFAAAAVWPATRAYSFQKGGS